MRLPRLFSILLQIFLAGFDKNGQSDGVKTNSIQSLPATIHDMLNSRGWDCFISDRLGNDLFLSNPDRAERIHAAAENGADGSTHAEHIDDWRDYVEQLREEAHKPWHHESDVAEIEAWHDRITAEIDACEAWHEANGSLHEEIG